LGLSVTDRVSHECRNRITLEHPELYSSSPPGSRDDPPETQSTKKKEADSNRSELTNVRVIRTSGASEAVKAATEGDPSGVACGSDLRLSPAYAHLWRNRAQSEQTGCSPGHFAFLRLWNGEPACRVSKKDGQVYLHGSHACRTRLLGRSRDVRFISEQTGLDLWS
jgi:hypothetical protein